MSKSLLLLTILGLISSTLALANQGDAIVRKLNVKGVAGNKGSVDRPLVITSAAEVAKIFPSEAVQSAINREVNFDREKLLYFSWKGSGQDQLDFRVEKKDNRLEVFFLYQPGLTRDLRPHAYLFTIPREAVFQVIPRRGKG